MSFYLKWLPKTCITHKKVSKTITRDKTIATKTCLLQGFELLDLHLNFFSMQANEHLRLARTSKQHMTPNTLGHQGPKGVLILMPKARVASTTPAIHGLPMQSTQLVTGQLPQQAVWQSIWGHSRLRFSLSSRSLIQL